MIKFDNIRIGKGHPCFIVAEIGINHNGDMKLAKEMMLAAMGAGCSAVKFQNYYTEDFILDKKLLYEYESEGKKVKEAQFEMFKRYELTVDELKELKRYSDSLGLVFFSTPTSAKGLADIVSIGCPIVKNGSDFLVNLELITEMGKSGLPTVISTGMATVGEIDDAVKAFENGGGKELLILHCTSAYPTPADQVNLKKIPAIESAFGYPIGFSDHTDGIVAAIGAVTLGAVFIEKHFTTDKNLAGPDHRFSADPEEMKALVDGIRFLEKSIGSSKIKPTKIEQMGRVNYRLSCVANKDLSKGHCIKKEDITLSRPATGLSPNQAHLLHGRVLTSDVRKGKLLLIENIT